MIWNTSVKQGGGAGCKTVLFTVSDWVSGTDGYTLTLAQSNHEMESGDFSYTLYHDVDGTLKSGTWALLGTTVRFDTSTSNIILSSGDAYAGKMIITA